MVGQFDQIAAQYDRTRGGERRGDEYAAFLWDLFPAGDDPVLEIGVGTGVVALGLLRRGRRVLGLDVSWPMAARARERLGMVVAQSDGTRMAIASESIAHAVSVWVVHAVQDPERLFREAARVLRPGGSYVVCSAQRPAAHDLVGQVIEAMGEAVDRRRGASRPRGVTGEEVLTWAASSGFDGVVRRFDCQWLSSPSEELAAIESRSWPAMRELDDQALEEVTKPAIEALRALPDGPSPRRATADVLVLHRP